MRIAGQLVMYNRIPSAGDPKLTNLGFAKGFLTPISVCIWILTPENQGYIHTHLLQTAEKYYKIAEQLPFT